MHSTRQAAIGAAVGSERSESESEPQDCEEDMQDGGDEDDADDSDGASDPENDHALEDSPAKKAPSKVRIQSMISSRQKCSILLTDFTHCKQPGYLLLYNMDK